MIAPYVLPPLNISGRAWPALIGLMGKARVGKDTFARHLKQYGYTQIALAWPLKIEGLAAGYSYEELFGDHKTPGVRDFLQQYGADQRAVREEYWLEQVAAWRRLGAELRSEVAHVISDIRYPNEAEWVKANGGILVRIHFGDRPDPLLGTPAAAHKSETLMDGYPADINVVNGRGTTPYGLVGQMMLSLARTHQDAL